MWLCFAARFCDFPGMNSLKKFLFAPARKVPGGASLGLFVLRLTFSVALMTHGFAKAQNFEALAAGGFADPLGFGSGVAVSLAIFAELVCPLAVVFGFLARLAVLPPLVTMAVAFFEVHGGSLANGELAFLHLAAFVSLFIAGPGRYSLDALIGRRFKVVGPR